MSFWRLKASHTAARAVDGERGLGSGDAAPLVYILESSTAFGAHKLVSPLQGYTFQFCQPSLVV